MSFLLSVLPKGFPEEVSINDYFLKSLSSTAAIWIVHIVAVLIFAGFIAWWIYLEHKNRPEDK